MVAKLLFNASFRFYLRHPAQLLLSLVGIILGICIVTAVIVTNASSKRAFELSASAITGQATHQISGSATGIDQQHYVDLRKSYSYPMSPVIEGYLGIGKELFTVLGIDPFSNMSQDRSAVELNPRLIEKLLASKHALLISEITQARLEFPIGEPVTAKINSRFNEFTIVGTYASQNSAATAGLLVGDIGHVQALLGRNNRIDRIDLVLKESQVRKLLTTLPVHLKLETASRRTETLAEMTRGFHINLTAMSLLALLVGGFLIYNTMTFSVLHRRELFSLLRISGFTASGIFTIVMLEAIAISVVGSVIGVFSGYFLAKKLIVLTTQTINDLYFALQVQDIWIDSTTIFLIILLGVLTSVLAASASAYTAARRSPLEMKMRSLTETSTRSMLPIVAAAGVLIMLAGAYLATVRSASLLVGFIALMLLITGYGLLAPYIVAVSSEFLRTLTAGSNVIVHLTTSSIHRSISRIGLAIAALTIAVSSTFGVDIMIGSFRNSVDIWLKQTLQNDIYLSAEGTAPNVADGTLSREFHERISQLNDVQELGTTRGLYVSAAIKSTLESTHPAHRQATMQATRSTVPGRQAPTPLGAIYLNVLEPNSRSSGGFSFIPPDDQPVSEHGVIWNNFVDNGQVLISEPLATRRRLKPGDLIELFTTTKGYQSFIIAGIYRDYGSSHGRITISRNAYNAHWHNEHWKDNAISAMGIIVKAGTDISKLLVNLRAIANETDNLVLIRSNEEIRQQSLEVFDRTFQVTKVLRLLTIGVAFIGIFSALLALQLEKAREFAVLRATGATQYQVAAIVSLQTVIMGLMAGLLALPLGWIMSEVLINVINVRSFGWSMSSSLPPGSIQVTMFLALGASVLAGLYPSWKLGQANIAIQLYDE